MKQIKFEVKLENGQSVEVEYDENNIRVISKLTKESVLMFLTRADCNLINSEIAKRMEK